MIRPTKRKPVNKHKSAGKFRKHVGKTEMMNMRNVPMRGGWRL